MRQFMIVNMKIACVGRFCHMAKDVDKSVNPFQTFNKNIRKKCEKILTILIKCEKFIKHKKLHGLLAILRVIRDKKVFLRKKIIIIAKNQFYAR